MTYKMFTCENAVYYFYEKKNRVPSVLFVMHTRSEKAD